MNEIAKTKIRIDKWLWAARFFKTRSIAKQAIDGGKVHIDGQRVKASKDIEQGMQISIRQGFDEKTVIVVDVSGKRGPAVVAAKLYSETAESIEKREKLAQERKANATQIRTDGKPNTRQRRHIHRFKREILSN